MRLSGTVYSEVLGMDTGISIVTPNNLKEMKDYSVVYLLHGLCGSSKTWLDYSMLPVYAAGGNSVYILPDAARSFYNDMKYGFRYFTYLTEELPEICKNVFHISSARQKTAVMGGSMGGYGALKCALSKPEQYGMCGAFSSGCLFLKEGLEEFQKGDLDPMYKEHFGEQLIRDFLAIFGENLEWRPESELLDLVRGLKESPIRPKLYMTCGTEDYFYESHIRFWEELKKECIEFEREEWKAKHDFIYFDQALKKAIEKFGL